MEEEEEGRWPTPYRRYCCVFFILSFVIDRTSIYFLTVTRSSFPSLVTFFHVRVLPPLSPSPPSLSPITPHQPQNHPNNTNSLRRHRFPPTLRRRRRRCQGLPPLRRRPQQAEEQRGGLRGAGAELRVELRGHEVGVRRPCRACIAWWVGGWSCVIE